MKIDKKNPRHLFALAVSVADSCLVMVLRPFLRFNKPNSKIIIFYGHTLNGNLKSFFDYLAIKSDYKPFFLTLDKAYYKRLVAGSEYPERILSAFSLKDMITIAKADAVITSHGLHLFSILRFTSIKFIDVWHAVSYKGFHKDDFKLQRSFDQSWVSSNFMKKMYINRFGFQPHKIKVTGYARTDQLVNGSLDKEEILTKYSIPVHDKYVLIAPTWQQDVPGRDILPFNTNINQFFEELDRLAQDNSAYIIFRTHFNSGDLFNVPNLTNTGFMPYSKYEIAEDFLFIADILITDWSSIGIDYLPLKRPTIFLDVPAPFKNGFNLGPEHRFGEIVNDFSGLKKILKKYLKNPKGFYVNHSKQMGTTLNIAYGATLDGRSTQRYLENLIKLLK